MWYLRFYRISALTARKQTYGITLCHIGQCCLGAWWIRVMAFMKFWAQRRQLQYLFEVSLMAYI